MYGGISTGQVTVAATAGGTLIAPERRGRGAVTIVNHGTTNVFIGGDPNVTALNGVKLVGVDGASITLSAQSAIYGITASGSQIVSYVEAY